MSSSVWRIASCSALTLLLANCASQSPAPRQQMSAQNAREIGFFSDSRKYGRASPRMVDGNQSVPKGGGRDHVGRPYKIAGRWYTPRENASYTATGNSSWYGDAFHGRKTANGEIYDKNAYTAAHPTLPLPSYVRVTNTSNQRSIVVRVNDRGPYHGGRIIDVSERVATALDFKHKGTARVQVDYLRRASTAGSDDRMLFASLRTDGGGADLPGGNSSPAPSRPSIMVASNTEPQPTAQPAAFSRPVTAAPVAQPPQVGPVVSPAVAPAVSAPIARSVPLPKDRPFDLDAIPGGDRQIDRVNNGQVPRGGGVPVSPRPQPQPLPNTLDDELPAQVDARAGNRQRTAALHFAPTAGLSGQFGSDDPMRRLKTSFAPVQHKAAGAVESQVSVQAGVFRDSANADRVRKLLANHGDASIKEIGAGEARRFVVSAGGFKAKADADKAIAALAGAGIRDAKVSFR